MLRRLLPQYSQRTPSSPIGGLSLFGIIGSGSEARIWDATLRQEGVQSPVHCVAKEMIGRNILNHVSSRQEFDVQSKLAQANASGIIPSLCLVSKPASDTRGPVDYHVQAKCGTILNYCIDPIQQLQNTHPNLFQHVVIQVISGLINGLDALEKTQLVHNDINPSNIGLHGGEWKLFDCTQAEPYERFCTSNFLLKGTPLYMPPELHQGEKQFPFPRDAWAVGQIVLQLMGRPMMFQEHAIEGHLARFYQIKTMAYSHMRATTPLNAQSSESIQTQLRQQLNQHTSFQATLHHLANALCHILPEYRPDITTLRAALNQLKAQTLPLADPAQLPAFNAALVEEHQQRIYSTASPESGTQCSSVAELALNDESDTAGSVRESPIPDPDHQPKRLASRSRSGVFDQNLEDDEDSQLHSQSVARMA